MQPKEGKVSLYLLLSAYLSMVVIFVGSIYLLPTWVQNAQWRYISEVQQVIETTLKENSGDNLTRELQKTSEQFPMEIAVYQGKQEIYQTLKGVSFEDLKELLNGNAIIYETQGTIQVQGKSYSVWYSIYPPTLKVYVQQLMDLQLIVVLIAFIILLSITIILNRMVVKPLALVKKSLSKLEQYQLDDEYVAGTDQISQSVARFAHSLKTNITAVSRNHTELEYDLQLERERLSNMITISRGIIHDLKTPLHQTLIENGYLLHSQADMSTETKTIIEYNISRLDETMHQINEVLTLLDTDVQRMMEIKDQFDIVQMLQEIRNSLRPAMQIKQLLLTAVLPEQQLVTMNKVSARLIVHNILSNAINYGLPDSEIEIEAYVEDGYLYIRCQNDTTTANIQRIVQSEDLFTFVSEEDDNGEHTYSTGNGLYLIKELTHLSHGTYDLNIEDEMVTIIVSIPLNNEEEES